jgi:hypothetical protein
LVLALAGLLQACGGGGSGSGGSSGGGGNGTRLSVDTRDVTVEAEAGDFAPTGAVIMTVANPPAAGLTVAGRFSDIGIEQIDVEEMGGNQARLLVTFKIPGLLADDTYQDEVEIQVCTDDACNRQISGSPVTIRTHYTVDGGRTATVSRNSVELTVDTRDASPPVERIQVLLDQIANAGVFVAAENTTDAISSTSTIHVHQTQNDVQIDFLAGAALSPGMHDDTVTIRVCYEQTCAREVEGSPFTVATRVMAGAGAEAGLDPLPVLSRVALPHDVVDAEFSEALNAVVMVSTFPSNGIYVYDVATGVERSQSLSKAPAAVSIAPDGLTAAVGHDALISVFDLATLGQVGALPPTLLDLTSNTADVALDGHGFVHVFPASSTTFVQPHSVEIASNTESLGSAVISADERIRLHPGGDRLYAADRLVSPGDIARFDITTGAALYDLDSPYHGEFRMCGNLWFSENGQTIYTACGNAFRSTAAQADDMTFSGAMELSESELHWWFIRSLSESAAFGEIVLVEAEASNCHPEGGNAPCHTHFATYDVASLARQSVYSVGPVTVDDHEYAQQGFFVFHDAASGRKYLIGRAEDSPDPLQAYFLSVVE